MHITFLAYRLQRDRLMSTEFYRQDLEVLESLGYRVTVATRLREIPRDTDLVFLWWWNWLCLVGPALRLRGIPVCVTGSLEPEIYEGYPWWKRWLVRWGMRFADRSVFVSNYMINRLSELMRLENPLYCPHIVLDEYRLGNPENHRARPNIIFNVAWKRAANMRRKMIPELIDAFAIALRSVPDARLVLAGEPVDGEASLRQQADRLGVAHAIEWPGKISKEEKIRLMQQCGAYYQCSRHEGFGLAIAEAMACGAPVVVNRNTAIPEVVGDCGRYVRDESIESIAESLVQTLTHPEESRLLGLRAASRVDSDFRFSRRRDFFQELLTEMIGPAARPAAPGYHPRAA